MNQLAGLRGPFHEYDHLFTCQVTASPIPPVGSDHVRSGPRLGKYTRDSRSPPQGHKRWSRVYLRCGSSEEPVRSPWGALPMGASPGSLRGITIGSPEPALGRCRVWEGWLGPVVSAAVRGSGHIPPSWRLREASSPGETIATETGELGISRWRQAIQELCCRTLSSPMAARSRLPGWPKTRRSGRSTHRLGVPSPGAHHTNRPDLQQRLQ